MPLVRANQNIGTVLVPRSQGCDALEPGGQKQEALPERPARETLRWRPYAGASP